MPSLPDVNSASPANNVDTWNTNQMTNIARPRPNRHIHGPPPIITVNAETVPRTPVVGPPAPRSWISRPNPTSVAHNQRPAPSISPQSLPLPKGRRTSRRRRRAVSTKDDDQMEEELMDEVYGSEYWFRKARDARWTKWRESAFEVALNRSPDYPSPSKPDMKPNPIFIPFKPVDDQSRIPPLFEITLKLIFGALVQENDSNDQPNDQILDLLHFLPSHTQKSVLRYAAIHSPLDHEQLRTFYVQQDNKEVTSNANLQDMGIPLTHELLLSGRKADISLINQVVSLTNETERGVGVSNDVRTPHTIILFQTPNLSKRHLNSFPKTLTTLALIALPPPPTYRVHHHSASSSPNLPPNSNERWCSCPWCAAIPPAGSRVRASDATSSGKTAQICSRPPSIVTPTSVLPTLVTLPSLLPSLVKLDVSYNPWLTSEKAISGAKIPRTNHGVDGSGILGRWDLRLWGRLKVLAVRRCIDTSLGEEVAPLGDTYMGELREGMLSDAHASHGANLIGEPSFKHHNLIKPRLVENWERLFYAIGRKVDVVWKEEPCSNQDAL
jgi:hypothetical protein